MKIIDVEQRSEEWLAFRRGKIPGTMLGDLYSKRGGRKLGFYQVLAERLGLEPDDENRMDRGTRLEDEATAAFEAITGKKVHKVGICVSDIDPRIINSPDGLIRGGKKKQWKEALEAKCLSPARHLQAVIENQIPDEFESQKIQYFIVNEELETLYFAFYDPRIPSVPLHIIPVHRHEVADKIEQFTAFQLEQLKEMDAIVERLAF